MKIFKSDIWQVCLKCHKDLVGLNMFDYEGNVAPRFRENCYECDKNSCKEKES